MADWLAIEGEYRAGVRSLRKIAAEHGASEANIRKQAKKNGWVRDPSGVKREMVRAALAGSAQSGAHRALRTIAESAEDAVSDMQSSLEVARAALRCLLEAAKTASDPRKIKIIVEANKLNVETIRLILSLDEPVKPESAKTLADVVNAMREVYGL